MPPTIYEVSKLAGVSLATVSRVINNSGKVSPTTRKKVEDAGEAAEFDSSVLPPAISAGSEDDDGLEAVDEVPDLVRHLARA